MIQIGGIKMSEPEYHIGRSWTGTALEDDCPCPKASCGLVVSSKIKSDCPQHSLVATKTIRQMHSEDNCPKEKV